jgi:hypothetical protein
MAKKRVRKKGKSIGGWLILILILLICSVISTIYLLMQKIIAIFTKIVGTGVYISAILLIIYSILLLLTIFFIINKKKKAIKTFIIAIIAGALFSIWYYIIGKLIYYPELKTQILTYNITNVIINLGISIAIGAYLLKSKRVKSTLTK